MRRPTARLLIGLCGWVSLAGCAHVAPDAGTTAVPKPVPALPLVARTNIDIEEHTPAPAAEPTEEARTAFRYRGLTELACQCLAAANSPIGNMLDQENLADQPASHRVRHVRGEDQAGPLLRKLRHYAALEARNQSSGAALEMYFRLAEAEAKSDLLGQGRTQLGEAIARAKELKAKGVRLTVEPDVLERQRLTSEADAAQADLAVRQLNVELKRRIGLPPSPDAERLWPQADWNIRTDPPDVERAIQTALATRGELLGLRTAQAELTPETLSAVRPLLQGINPLLGTGAAGGPAGMFARLRLLCSDRGACESAVRRDQIAGYLADRERAVADEVRQAAQSLEAHTRLVALARERIESWQKRLAEIQERAKKGLSPFPEEENARLELLKARGELVTAVMAWHVARVKFRQAQGLLAAECVGAEGRCAGGPR